MDCLGEDEWKTQFHSSQIRKYREYIKIHPVRRTPPDYKETKRPVRRIPNQPIIKSNESLLKSKFFLEKDKEPRSSKNPNKDKDIESEKEEEDVPSFRKSDFNEKPDKDQITNTESSKSNSVI